MAKQTGTLDPSFQLLNTPPGLGTPVAISIGRDVGPATDLATKTYPTINDLVLLVSTGTHILVYNPTTGVYMGSFSVPGPFVATSLGSTDTLTVMGDATTNQLQMIDVFNSLQAGTAEPPANPSGHPAPGSTRLPPTTLWWAA